MASGTFKNHICGQHLWLLFYFHWLALPRVHSYRMNGAFTSRPTLLSGSCGDPERVCKCSVQVLACAGGTAQGCCSKRCLLLSVLSLDPCGPWGRGGDRQSSCLPPRTWALSCFWGWPPAGPAELPQHRGGLHRVPILVCDGAGSRPQLQCCLGAPRAPVFPGCTQGEHGPTSSRWGGRLASASASTALFSWWPQVRSRILTSPPPGWPVEDLPLEHGTSTGTVCELDTGPSLLPLKCLLSGLQLSSSFIGWCLVY